LDELLMAGKEGDREADDEQPLACGSFLIWTPYALDTLQMERKGNMHVVCSVY